MEVLFEGFGRTRHILVFVVYMNYLVCGYLAQHYITLTQIITIINSSLNVSLFNLLMSSATSSGAAESAQTFISIHALTRSAMLASDF